MSPEGKTRCRPRMVSHFEVERQVDANGVQADIRRLAWDRACDGHFSADSYYVDYALIPRSARSRLIHTDHQPTRPGEIVFLPQGCELDAHCEPCEQLLLCVTFQHDQILRLFEGDLGPTGLSPCFDVRTRRVRGALVRLAEEIRQPGFGHDVLIESLTLSLLVMLCRHLQKQPRTEGPPRSIADWRLRRVKDRIEAGLAGTLSIASLAGECGMSPRHLSRTFRSTVGVTLSDYIADMRIARAKEELAKDEALIKVIAGACGFLSAAAFSGSFRRATGMTPMQFRQQHVRIRP